MIRLFSDTSDKTEEIGRQIGAMLKNGDVVCLTGDLGVGKTTFVKGLAKGLNIEEHLTSPTFTIVNEYQGNSKLYHFDVYRVSDPDELYGIGFEEYIYSDAVSVIEWAELITSILPENKLWIKINKDLDKGTEYREIIIEAYSNQYDNLITRLTKDWSENE